MAAIESMNPTQTVIVKVFAYAFHAAPTADLVDELGAVLDGGMSPAALLNQLFNVSLPGSPFAAYADGSTDGAFVGALVDNFCFGTSISAATRLAWRAELMPLLPQHATRGDFVVMVALLVEGYTGNDTDLLALQSALHERAEKAAIFASSPAGATWDGSVGQLLAPLEPPPPEPTYALSASATSVNEGSSTTFTLTTTGIAAGIAVPYTLGGTGITAGDIVGGQLAGTLTVGAGGTAQLGVTFVLDAATEGRETLRLTLGGGHGQIEVLVNDTSTAPPTYALSADRTSVDEGAAIVYTLTTSQVTAGTVIPFALSGAGITADDIVGGSLTGNFTIGANGIAQATVGLRADATTEGAEVLRLQLSGNLAQVEVKVNDTSPTPPPAGRPDLVIVADSMDSSQASRPPSPAEGEIGIDTFLSYDFLDQSGGQSHRLTIADLRATGTVAGAPLVATNHSADRGNIPQVSNQHLFTFDLGLDIDRVDYSAEQGRIVAVVGPDAAAATQYVLVNDDAVDRVFDGKTDRIDTLVDVEQIVASAGGGVIDLTASGRDLLLTFSRHFNPATDVDAARDRATHRLELSDLDTGAPLGRSYIDVRDAGLSPDTVQPLAAWAVVEGSDHDETLVFSDAESPDARSANLRGGINTVKFNELTRSILVDVEWTPWVDSTDAADDVNASGTVAARVSFTIGDGLTLLTPNVNLLRSHTADNEVAAGLLKIVGTQDAEDAIGFEGSTLPKLITIGAPSGAGVDVVRVRTIDGPATDSLEISGFEIVRDHVHSDDVYAVLDLAHTAVAGPRLADGGGADHDTIRVTDVAVGSLPAGGVAGTLNLATINGAALGLNFDFDVLDLTALTRTGITVSGTPDFDDELVVGALGAIQSVTAFESLVLSAASTDEGSSLTLDLDAGVVAGVTGDLFGFSGRTLSAGGLVFGSAGQPSHVPPLAGGLQLRVQDSSPGAGAVVWGGAGADTITGGAGDDLLRGGGGNDVLDGGAVGETWRFALSGAPDPVTVAGNRITLTLTIDGKVLTLVEAANADTAYGDGNGAVVDGATRTAIGNALAGLVNANLAAINAGPGSGTLLSASYGVAAGELLLSFAPGTDADDLVSLVLDKGAGPDGGSFAVSTGGHVNGGDGGSDTFVFEASAALNGVDTIVNFSPGADRLNVTAFTGAPVIAAGTAVDGAIGGVFSGLATTAQFVFNKTGGTLATSDFAATATAGKLVLTDGARYVVAVTADPTGAFGDAANTPVSLYYVVNGAASGLGDLSVGLVGTISSVAELTLADVHVGLS